MTIEETIAEEVYAEYQLKSNGLKNCLIACNIGDIDEHILQKYIKDKGIVCQTEEIDYTVPNL